MAALDAVVNERMEKLKEERCLKQKTRIRLTADPAISVTSLVAILVAFLKYKQTKIQTNKKHCAEDCMDRLDFMIRVFLNMVILEK